MPQLPPKKLCYVISPIGPDDSNIRKNADGFLREIVRPVLKKLGYSVERADDNKSPGIITRQIIKNLLRADIVVANLTELKANVMYELAVAHVAARPVVQMMENSPSRPPLPFDIYGQKTIFFEFTEAKLARSELKKAVPIARDVRYENPIGTARLFAKLPSSALKALLTQIRNAIPEIPRDTLSAGEAARWDRILKITLRKVRDHPELRDRGIKVNHVSGHKFMVNAQPPYYHEADLDVEAHPDPAWDDLPVREYTQKWADKYANEFIDQAALRDWTPNP